MTQRESRIVTNLPGQLLFPKRRSKNWKIEALKREFPKGGRRGSLNVKDRVGKDVARKLE